jgi:Pilus assembly protein, PilO/Fimbrial assembly protein (PilN)
MAMRITLIAGLGISMALVACNSGPSSSGAASSRESEAAKLQRKAEHIGGLVARRPLAAEAFDTLTAALPDRVRLTEIVYDPKGIQAKGNAPSNTVLADYMSRLAENPPLTDVVLRGSSLRTVRGRERVEFLLQAALREPGALASSDLPPLAGRQEPSEMLREIQRLTLDSGLQMTRFVPGVEIAGEFTGELAASIEVAGSIADISRFLRGLAGLARLWVVERFSLKAAAADDPRSDVRASLSARAYFVR